MHLRALELVQLLHGKLRRRIRHRAHGQGDEHFVRVQAGVAVAEVLDLEVLDGREDGRGDQVDLRSDAGQML